MELMGNAIDLARHGREGFEMLANVAKQCSCYRLVVGDLDEACRTIANLVDDRTPQLLEGT
jgi:hypothetical protein